MKFVDAIEIAAPAAALFELTQDYGRRLEWDPFLRSAELLDGAHAAGIGVRAWCVATSGLGMETEYVSFSPPQVAAVKMTRGPRLLKSFAGSWRFEPLDAGRTRVEFAYAFETRPSVLSWLLTPLARRSFERDTQKRLAALKRFAELKTSGY